METDRLLKFWCMMATLDEKEFDFWSELWPELNARQLVGDRNPSVWEATVQHLQLQNKPTKKEQADFEEMMGTLDRWFEDNDPDDES